MKALALERRNSIANYFQVFLSVHPYSFGRIGEQIKLGFKNQCKSLVGCSYESLLYSNIETFSFV